MDDLPTEQASRPLPFSPGRDATCSTHFMPNSAMPVTAPSAPIRGTCRRHHQTRSRPAVASGASASTAPSCASTVRQPRGRSVTRRRVPSPSANAAMAPPRSKLALTTKASSSCGRRGTPAGSWRSLARLPLIAIRILIRDHALEPAPQPRPVQVAPDEHDAAHPRLALLPRPDEIAIRDHMHRLECKPPLIIRVRQDALRPQQIRPLCLQQRTDPCVELLRIDRLLHLEAYRRHVVIVLVLVVSPGNPARSPARGSGRSPLVQHLRDRQRRRVRCDG